MDEVRILSSHALKIDVLENQTDKEKAIVVLDSVKLVEEEGTVLIVDE